MDPTPDRSSFYHRIIDRQHHSVDEMLFLSSLDFCFAINGGHRFFETMFEPVLQFFISLSTLGLVLTCDFQVQCLFQFQQDLLQKLSHAVHREEHQGTLASNIACMMRIPAPPKKLPAETKGLRRQSHGVFP